ncbi:hypothetical protein HPB51_009677 [Rhipicephalus microplus]|uniref:Uncharacterized protein n=1 Tax=Rhipicephalus microplus TaxID=6941 RepID=A0A9J6ESE7_RHIMP|nr:hypothetical protein HPB51_009677 [Rhipicephalus microplus]
MTATTSALGASISSSEPDHLQVMSTVVVPKCKRRRKRKPMQTFGFKSTSRGPDNMPPSNAETDLRKLLAHLRMQQEAVRGEAHKVFVLYSLKPKVAELDVVDITYSYEMSGGSSPSGEDDLRKADEVYVQDSAKATAASTITTTVSTKDPGEDWCVSYRTKAQPALTLRRRHPPLPPKTKEKSRAHPIGELDEVSRAAAGAMDDQALSPARRDFKSAHSSQEASPAKSKVEEQMTRLAQMAKTLHPEYTEREMRIHIDHSRRSQKGVSRVTFNAMDYMLRRLESQEKL